MKRLAVFASGNGTNFQAIVSKIKEGKLKVELPLLIVDKKEAYALQRAKEASIDAYFINPKEYASKEEYEEEILKLLVKYKIDFIALAGYMRLIGDVLLKAYEGRIVNIHPSLLPAFKGKNAIEQAFEYGVKVMGVSIHYVDKGMDTGRIIAQDSFHVMPLDTIEDVEASIHAIEHRLYPEVLRNLLED